MSDASAQNLRLAVIEALPSETSLYGRVPDPRHVYIPPSHVRALRLEHDIVVGGRGVGKSFWSAALRDTGTRKMLGGAVARLPEVIVQGGFGEASELSSYPDAEIFSGLISSGIEAYNIWRAVIARWAMTVVPHSKQGKIDDWRQTVSWVISEPEGFARLMEQANRASVDNGTHALIVFDALDKLSDDWAVMDKIVRDLLRIILSVKTYSNLHAKAFLREDQFENRLVTNFPDASKLQANRVDLTWAPHDLHGLLWQYLINADGTNGGDLRKLYNRTVTASLIKSEDGIWQLRNEAKREGEIQKQLFAALASQFMGSDRRRGLTYTWSVGHLADSRRRTSPRSFLAGIRAAADDSFERYPEHPYPLHHESIKRGVQKASVIRVNEMAEDYPWVKVLLDPLSGLTVPCTSDMVIERWQAEFGESSQVYDFGKLPPEHASSGWIGIQDDLINLGIFERMKDYRINMPDLYRVGFGLGRRGGVRPMASLSQT